MSTIRKIPIDVPEPDAVSPNGQTDAAQAETPPEAPEATPAAVPTPADQADMLAAERDALSDALLRQRAEFDNYRRRSVRELAESRDRAQANSFTICCRCWITWNGRWTPPSITKRARSWAACG